MSDLTKKQAELKQLQSTLENRKKGKKSKKVSFKKNHKMSYDASKGIYENLKKKSSKSLTDDEKKFLKDYDQIQTYDQIIRTYEKKIAELKKAIATLKKNTTKANGTNKTTVYKCKNNKCKTKPKAKFLGNICITIDHFGIGKAKTSLDVVKELRQKNIPVTVFVQCTSTKQLMTTKAEIKSKKLLRQPISTFSDKELEMIKDMKALGAKIGIHLLGNHDVIGLNEETATQKQIDNIKYMKSVKDEKGKVVIGDVKVASYHGNEIEKVAGLQNSYVQDAFRCIRGTSSTKPSKLTKYTTVSYSLGDIKKNKNKVTHFFFHSHQTTGNALYKELLEGVKKDGSGKYKAVAYTC